jgi:hypothetical protein
MFCRKRQPLSIALQTIIKKSTNTYIENKLLIEKEKDKEKEKEKDKEKDKEEDKEKEKNNKKMYMKYIF